MCALVQPWTPIRMYQYRYMVDIDWTYAYLCKFESFLFDICVMSGFLYCFFIYCFRCTICVLLCALCVGKENHINSNASVVFCVCVCVVVVVVVVVVGGGGGGGGGGVSVDRYTTPIHWRHDGEKIANEANHLKSIPRPLWLSNLSCEYFRGNVLQWVHMFSRWHGCMGDRGPVSIERPPFPSMVIPMLKIRRSARPSYL